MELSIIIVSYNVKYFIDQCIASIRQSHFNGQYEIIIVDNASSDGSCEFIKTKYPDVQLIENVDNVGFSKANNQGVERSRGKSVLILNPDTILSSNTLQVCSDFVNKRNNVGALGVRMYDGSGTYLPESKRGFPTPFVSFCKIFGLSHLFPESKAFNRYYLGYLAADEIQEVDILTGAFMFMNKDTYKKVNGFDEDYFMYGEDIDLSYRIQKLGLKNYYTPETSIIHYKGESTRKMSFDYVRRFYEAMIIFAKKHNSGAKVAAYTFAIMSAIYLNAFFTFLNRMKNRLTKPLIDAAILGGSFYLIKGLWERYYFHVEHYFSDSAVLKNGLVYVFISIVVYLLFGKYHKTFKSWRWMKILTAAILTLLVIYSLLPSELRFSRAVLVLGATLASVCIFILDRLRVYHKSNDQPVLKRTIVVGDPVNSDRLLALLDKRQQTEFVGFVNKQTVLPGEEFYIGSIDSVDSIVRFHNVNEVIFDQQEISTSDIMRVMTTLDHACQYKIYTSDTGSVVGSYSKEFQGEVDTFEIEYAISSSYHRFIKRFADISLCIVALLLLPLFWLMNGMRMNFIQHVFSVLKGNNSWVGYLDTNAESILPAIKQGIIGFQSIGAMNMLNESQKMQFNFIYAREYSVWMDVRAFFNQITNL